MQSAGLIVYNNRPMRAEFYLTLQRGLLAVALYHSRNRKIVRMTGSWTVPVSGALSNSETPGEMTMTTVSPLSWQGESNAIDNGMVTSATPVCGFRRSLHV